MTNNKLTHSFVIAAFSFCTLAACNSGDYTSSENSTTKDSSGVAAGTGNSGAISPDTMSSAATTPAAGTAAASGTSTVAKRKGKMTIKMPADNGTATTGTSTPKMTKDKDGVYSFAQAMPQFPGGQNALDNYVNNNIDYPKQAIDDNTAGTVRVSFVVDEQGKVTRAHIIGNKLGNGLDEQALKVVSNMPTWKPGQVNGKKVKIRMELPIAFQVEA